MSPTEVAEGIDRIVRPPVGVASRGICLFDTDGHRFDLCLENFGADGYTVVVDPDFNPHFFAIALEYLLAHLLALQGYFLCHASCVRMAGKTILFPAWRHTGKTNLLLDFLLDGADYLADDWLIVSKDGQGLTLPKRLNLLHYNFLAAPELLDLLPADFQSLHSFVKRAESGEFDINPDVMDLLREQARLRVSVEDLFGRSPVTEKVSIDQLILLHSVGAECAEGRLEPLAVDDAAQALIGIQNFEQQYFVTAVDAFSGMTGSRNAQLSRARSLMPKLVDTAVQAIPVVQKAYVPHQELVRGSRSWLLDGV